jgi:hypothetical protein
MSRSDLVFPILHRVCNTGHLINWEKGSSSNRNANWCCRRFMSARSSRFHWRLSRRRLSWAVRRRCMMMLSARHAMPRVHSASEASSSLRARRPMRAVVDHPHQVGVARFFNVASYVQDKRCPTELSEKQRDKVQSDGTRIVRASLKRDRCVMLCNQQESTAEEVTFAWPERKNAWTGVQRGVRSCCCC